jgi:hypothetical protein
MKHLILSADPVQDTTSEFVISLKFLFSLVPLHWSKQKSLRAIAASVAFVKFPICGRAIMQENDFLPVTQVLSSEFLGAHYCEAS